MTAIERDSRTETATATPTWARAVVDVASALALLLFGATGGLLLDLAGSHGPTKPGPGSVEVGFAQDMTAHHRQAVTMAALARDRSTDPEIRQLAFDIETSQRDQVGRMQGWLDLWDQLPQHTGPPMRWMHLSGNHSEHTRAAASSGAGGMPGMASPAELRRLRTAHGPAMDVEFLRLMLRHHRGGLAMAGYAAEHAALPQVANLARTMRTSQSIEADTIRRMLAARGATALPPP